MKTIKFLITPPSEYAYGVAREFLKDTCKPSIVGLLRELNGGSWDLPISSIPDIDITGVEDKGLWSFEVEIKCLKMPVVWQRCMNFIGTKTKKIN